MNAAIPIRQARETAPVTLAEVCGRLAEAKDAEAAASAARLQAEQAVLALVGELPAEGTTRKDAGPLQLVIQTSIRRSVDADKLAAIAGRIPEEIGKRLIRWKPELVARELHYLQNNEPDLYGVVATAIEAKPAKPSIRLEPTKEAA